MAEVRGGVRRSAGLAGDGRSCLLGRLGIAEVYAAGHGEILVQAVPEGEAGRYLQADDVVVAYLVDVLAEGPEAVAVGHDQNGPAPAPGANRSGTIVSSQ